MPIFVYVILGIALLLVLLLSSKIKLFIIYEEELTVYAKFLFFKFPIISDEMEDKPKRAKRKKTTRKGTKKKGNAPQDAPSVKKAPEKSTVTKLFEIKEIILRFIDKFFKKLHFRFIKLKIVVACENAAATALAYGAVTQGVSYILELLNSVSTVEINKNSDISVTTDFLSQKSQFEGSVELYARLLPVLVVGFGSLLDYIKYKSTTEE